MKAPHDRNHVGEGCQPGWVAACIQCITVAMAAPAVVAFRRSTTRGRSAGLVTVRTVSVIEGMCALVKGVSFYCSELLYHYHVTP